MGRLQSVFHSRYSKPVALFTLMIVVASLISFQAGIAYYSPTVDQYSDYEVHATVVVKRDGQIIYTSHHAGVLMNTAKDYVEGKLGNSGFANATDYAVYISLSTSSSSPVATWTDIPTEITTNGLNRQLGTYTSTGVGVWEIEKEFTATGTHTDVQLLGLNWDSVANDGSLFCADTCTPVTLESDDKITVTFEITASGS